MDNSSVHESRWESKLDSHYRCWKPQSLFQQRHGRVTKALTIRCTCPRFWFGSLRCHEAGRFCPGDERWQPCFQKPSTRCCGCGVLLQFRGPQWRFLPLILSHRLPWSWLLPAPHVLEQAFFTAFLVVPRAIPRLLNKRLICLTQPKVLWGFFKNYFYYVL